MYDEVMLLCGFSRPYVCWYFRIACVPPLVERIYSLAKLKFWTHLFDFLLILCILHLFKFKYFAANLFLFELKTVNIECNEISWINVFAWNVARNYRRTICIPLFSMLRNVSSCQCLNQSSRCLRDSVSIESRLASFWIALKAIMVPAMGTNGIAL